MFLRAWIANPLQTAAIAPSGKALARLMTRDLSPQTGPVIELGPGTGAFTYAALARGVPEANMTLIEYSAEFARLLGRRFPKAEVVRGDAAKLRRIGPQQGLQAGAVISGLPVLTMPPRQVIAILDGAFHHLRPDGAFYQFTYMPRCPIPQRLLDRMGLKAVRVGRTFANLPPASVYRITRRRPMPPVRL